jgi:hypothetical protein
LIDLIFSTLRCIHKRRIKKVSTGDFCNKLTYKIFRCFWLNRFIFIFGNCHLKIQVYTLFSWFLFMVFYLSILLTIRRSQRFLSLYFTILWRIRSPSQTRLIIIVIIISIIFIGAFRSSFIIRVSFAQRNFTLIKMLLLILLAIYFTFFSSII